MSRGTSIIIRLVGLGLVVGGNALGLSLGEGAGSVIAYSLAAFGALLIVGGRFLGRDENESAPRSAPSRAGKELRVGWPALLVSLYAILHYPLIAAAVVPFVTFGLLTGAGPPVLLPTYTLGPAGLIGLGLATWMVIRMGKLATGTRGRVRVLLLATGMFVRSIGYGVLATVLSLALTDPAALMVGLGLGESLMPVGQMPAIVESFQLVTNAQGTYTLLQVGIAFVLAGAGIELCAVISCWFLLPIGFRTPFWLVFDTGLLFGFVAVTLLLPIRPLESAPNEITLPGTRLGITALFCIRMLFRTLPVILDGIETVGMRGLIAARMMRAKKSGFLTTIGALSILAVSFSSCTLTTTLSVMGGFRDDLKRKILGNNAHVLVDQERGTFEGWLPILDTIRAHDDVIAATPYVQGEVMITSATNLGGAVIRGIDPETIGDVTEIRQNMRHGRLEYLSDPERLLRLRPSEMGAGLLSPLFGEDDDVARGSIFDDAEDALSGRPEDDDEPRDEPRPDPDTERIRDEINEFLHDGGALGDEPVDAPPAADILPGLIVGQELARTLRLHVGDEVNVVSPLGELGPTGPIPKSRPFRIAGIFYSGMYEFDMKMAYTTLEAAQAFLSVGDAISGIEIKVEDTDQAEQVAVAIAASLGRPSLRVRAWQEVNRNLFGALQLEKLAMFITLGIAILVASFCIVGTLTLLVQEKRKEVGILKAMGATGEQIVAVFMYQGLMIGTLGASTGLGLGYLATFIMEHFGIHLNPEVYYIDKLPVHVDANEFIVTGIAAVIVCLLATIYPAILGSRLTPMDALRSS